MSDREAIFKRLNDSLVQSGEKVPMPDYYPELIVVKPRSNEN